MGFYFFKKLFPAFRFIFCFIALRKRMPLSSGLGYLIFGSAFVFKHSTFNQIKIIKKMLNIQQRTKNFEVRKQSKYYLYPPNLILQL